MSLEVSGGLQKHPEAQKGRKRSGTSAPLLNIGHGVGPEVQFITSELHTTPRAHHVSSLSHLGFLLLPDLSLRTVLVEWWQYEVSTTTEKQKLQAG